MTPFDEALRRTLGFEGGESDVVGDRGGHTKWGVTQRTYDAWRTTTGESRQSVALMTTLEMRTIYHEDFWDAIHGDELPIPLALVVFDMAVNSNPHAAALTLQRSLGVNADGKIGAVTIASAHTRGMGAVLAFLKQRAAFLQDVIRTHPTDVQFLEGWICRLLDQAWSPRP